MENLIDLHRLREDLKEAKITRTNKTDKIREMNERIKAKKAEQHANLKEKRLRLSNNKEKREHYGLTNQKDWNDYIKTKLTNEDEARIERAYQEGMAIIISCKKEVEFLNIKIADLEWQLRIELAGLDIYGLSEEHRINPAAARITE